MANKLLKKFNQNSSIKDKELGKSLLNEAKQMVIE